MKKLILASSLGAVFLAVVIASAALAHGDRGGGAKAKLSGFQETSLTLSTTGHGSFRVKIRSSGIQYTLKYEDLEADANAAHIHLGARGLTGGVIAFLCSGGDKPACPAREGTVTGVIDSADVIGPAGQGIEPGALQEVIRAIRAGAVYANVHTSKYGGGEIRGQVGKNDHDHKHSDRKGK
jgi:hypothetical protein